MSRSHQSQAYENRETRCEADNPQLRYNNDDDGRYYAALTITRQDFVGELTDCRIRFCALLQSHAAQRTAAANLNLIFRRCKGFFWNAGHPPYPNEGGGGS